MNYSICELEVRDAAHSVLAINQLLRELSTSGRSTSKGDLEKTLEHCRIFVVKEKASGTIIGMGTISFAKQLGRSFCTIDDIVITKAHRGEGLFSLLMNKLEEVALHEFGVARLELHTSREDAAKRYLGRGYHLYESDIYRKPLI